MELKLVMQIAVLKEISVITSSFLEGMQFFILFFWSKEAMKFLCI